MIWALMSAIAIVSGLVVCLPLYQKGHYRANNRPEIQAYLTEIEQITEKLKNGEDAAGNLAARKTELERHLLSSSGRRYIEDARPARLMACLFVGFMLGTLGLYAAIGRPDLALTKPMTASVSPGQSSQSGIKSNGAGAEPTLTELLAQMKIRLDADPSNPQGWLIYARNLMSLGRYDEALSAYEKVLALTDNHPDIVQELADARALAADNNRPRPTQPPGPSADDINGAQSLSAQDRAAMINAMVEGLSSKLEDNPENIDGWVRLLNSRRVLGQSQAADAEISRMKAVFKDRTEIVNRILIDSGWPEALHKDE